MFKSCKKYIKYDQVGNKSYADSGNSCIDSFQIYVGKFIKIFLMRQKLANCQEDQEHELAETTTNEIGDLNLTYLLLAQRLVREDVATAMFRMGLSRELADLLGSLSLSQIVTLAGSSLLLCRFRFDDHPVLSALLSDGKTLALQQAHTAILLSGQQIEAVH